MDRRSFLKNTPAAVATIAVGGSVLPAQASGVGGGHEGAQAGVTAPEGFVLLSDTLLPHPVEEVRGMAGSFPLHSYVVRCPYPVGSRGWVAMADGDKEGCVVGAMADGSWPFKTSAIRITFPRFSKDLGVRAAAFRDDLQGRFERVYRVACQDRHSGGRSKTAWKVVHVEYRCLDGVEHIVCGMPLEWNSTLALGVMVRGQIV